ncbi:MAG: type II toxin-antitoxin system CcdA family antitoxin [Methylibium sp.]
MSQNIEVEDLEPHLPARVGSTSEAADGSKPADARERAKRWLAENAGAFASSNAFVAAKGLPLAKYRQF